MSKNDDYNRDISFKIVEEIGVITAYSTGWNKELNFVSWNGAAPKYDIRDWAPDHTHMSRGITLHEKEMRLIFDLLRNRGRHPYRGDYNGFENAEDQEKGDCAADSRAAEKLPAGM